MKPWRGLLRLSLVLLAGALAWSPAAAQESILRFDSEVGIQADGGLLVTETIQVRSEHQEIKHGIYRDFPTQYQGPRGGKHQVPFEVRAVTRDGEPEPYFTENLEHGIRVYIGRKDVTLDPGVYTYTLQYATNRQLGFFPDHDELYWNVTGNDWSFSIQSVQCRVSLPVPVSPDRLTAEAYTGARGARGRNYRTQACGPGCMLFASTRPLAPGEGMTIVLGWPKGVVAAPTAAQQRAYFIHDHRDLLVGLAGFLVLLVYYLVVWWLKGRDPRPGVIVPLFTPPEGLSPGALRYVRRMNFDQQCLTSTLINLAVKGWLRIEKTGKEYVLKKLPTPPGRRLTGDEAALFRSLLGGRDELTLDNSQHAIFQAAVKSYSGNLQRQYLGKYFLKNTAALIPGLVIAGLTFLATLIAAGRAMGMVSVFMLVWLTGWTAGVVMLSGLVLKSWRSLFRKPEIATLFSTLFITAFSLPFYGGEIFGLSILVGTSSPELVGIWGVLAALTLLFHFLLKAPTRIGRLLLDKIEGFTLFLTRAEKDRLELLHPPEQTPELFEKYLPYALALGVENRWAAQFQDVLQTAAAEGRTAYRPAWYSGAGFNAGALGSSLGSGLADAFSSAATAPGSRSGGGGGGSSGGGGGGGGGGGW